MTDEEVQSVITKKGTFGNAGDCSLFGLKAKDVYYCGRTRFQCRCGGCDGRCGPDNGCPCNTCIRLSGFVIINGILRRKGGTEGSAGDCKRFGLEPKDLYYCGRRQKQCRCGKCDGRCGPTNGCPCHSCVMLLDLKVVDGILRRKGNSGEAGDCQKYGMVPNELYYCGRNMGQCRCGCCDNKCGPNNGCPCLSCLDLVFDDIAAKAGNLRISDVEVESAEQVSEVEAEEGAGVGRRVLAVPPNEFNESKSCIVCLDERKEYIALPCGHFAYCKKCASALRECAVCKAAISSTLKVFEP